MPRQRITACSVPPVLAAHTERRAPVRAYRLPGAACPRSRMGMQHAPFAISACGMQRIPVRAYGMRRAPPSRITHAGCSVSPCIQRAPFAHTACRVSTSREATWTNCRIGADGERYGFARLSTVDSRGGMYYIRYIYKTSSPKGGLAASPRIDRVGRTSSTANDGQSWSGLADGCRLFTVVNKRRAAPRRPWPG